MDNSKGTGSLVMGGAYLVLVGAIMWFCAKETSTFDDFAKYWGLFGTIIGVVTGAIPAFFFKAQAEQAQGQAATAQADAINAKAQVETEKARADDEAARAETEAKRVRALREQVTAEQFDALRVEYRGLF